MVAEWVVGLVWAVELVLIVEPIVGLVWTVEPVLIVELVFVEQVVEQVSTVEQVVE